jgi:hypothetical protein
LQQEHSDDATDPRIRESLEYLRVQALGDGASERARWIYFCSPPWTWDQECGREGWLLYEPETGAQHAFSDDGDELAPGSTVGPLAALTFQCAGVEAESVGHGLSSFGIENHSLAVIEPRRGDD